MPRNVSGVYVLPTSDVNPPVFGTTIDQVAFANQNTDIANEITNSLDRLGRAPMLAILPMGGFRIQNVGAPSAQTDAARLVDFGTYLPSGAIQDFAMNVAPAGWLVCDGTAYSRTTYASLFAAVGTTWGVGDGSTTFNVPDFRGTMRKTWDNGAGIDPARVFASFQNDTLPVHNHTQNAHTHTVTDPGHFHGYQSPGGAGQSTTTVPTGVTNANTTAVNNAISAGIATKNYAILTCIRT